MRRALALLLTLCVLAGAGMIYAHESVDAQAEAVEFTHTLLYGEPEQAAGITVRVPQESMQHLFFDSTLTLGDESTSGTEFTFSKNSMRWRGRARHYGLSASLMMNMGGGGNFGKDFRADDVGYVYNSYFFSVYGDMLRDVASRAPAGQEYTERVELSDWLDCVPIEFNLDLEGFMYSYTDTETDITQSMGDMSELGALLAERFRIPLTEPFSVDVTIARDMNGDIVDWNINASDEMYEAVADDPKAEAAVSVSAMDKLDFNCWSVATDGGCFFAFEPWSEDSSLDFSVLPGGRGLYCLPYEFREDDSDVAELYLDDISCVLPLDSGERIEDLETDGERLVLLTSADGALYMTQAVLADTDHGEQSALEDVTRIRLTSLETLPEEYDMDDGVSTVEMDGGLLCVRTYGGHLLLLESASGGEYEMRLDVPAFPESEGAGAFDEAPQDWNVRLSYSGGSSMSWDGERLVTARWCQDDSNNRAETGPLVLVYDAGGLRYAGRFDSSLCRAPADYYDGTVHAFGTLKLTLG